MWRSNYLKVNRLFTYSGICTQFVCSLTLTIGCCTLAFFHEDTKYSNTPPMRQPFG